MKKQFRLYDIYRQAITGDMSAIQGIVCYGYVISTNRLYVHYNGKQHEYDVRNEEHLRNIIRTINKALNNCRKPGRRKKNVNK